jgi:hypothetical protein
MEGKNYNNQPDAALHNAIMHAQLCIPNRPSTQGPCAAALEMTIEAVRPNRFSISRRVVTKESGRPKAARLALS